MEIIPNITNITANHFAIANERPEINPNPNVAATIANIKNINAQINQPATPFLFIFTYSVIISAFFFTNTIQNKTVKHGFSWTVLFFGFIALFIRGQYLLALLAFLLGWMTAGITNIFFAFMANKALAKQLVSEGYYPIPEHERAARIAFQLVPQQWKV